MEDENIVERIRNLCEDRNISVAKMEEDLGFGNGFLNPKKVSDVKSKRLIKILNYIGISYEEFMNIGTPETQAIQTALVKIRKASPIVYEELLHKWAFSEPESLLTEAEKHMIDLFRLFNNYGQQLMIRYAESMLGVDSLIKEKNNANTDVSA